MRVILFFILSINSFSVSADLIKKEEMGRYDANIIESGKTVFSDFLACSDILELKTTDIEIDTSIKNYTNCTRRLFSSSLSKMKKDKYAAWALMNFNVTPLGICTDDYINEDVQHDLALCFYITIEDLEQSGQVTFSKENGHFKIRSIKY